MTEIKSTTSNRFDSDWQNTLSQVQTILDADLFPIFCQSASISLFIKDIFSTNTSMASEVLNWHFGSSDADVTESLAGLLKTWVADTAHDEAAFMAKLRQFRRAHSAAIAVLELNGFLPIESSSLRISLLADHLIEAAYRWSYRLCESRFGYPTDKNGRPLQLMILGMGKLGGKELNFSSDVDLIFFYPQDGSTHVASQDEGNQQAASGALSITTTQAKSTDNARFFRRVCTQLIKLLDEVTHDGFVFRVDMRLRPYGDSGALVMSLAQAEEYYQEQGREWERFAMVRCRVMTGDPIDRKRLDALLQPFSFRRYIDFGVIESIRGMKEMIQREVRRKGLKDNIKLGAGGIREIEFIVQSMQLIQGGRDKRLREKNVLKVLPLLVDAKLLPLETQQELSEAYRFLRRLEHCIQELAEKQTQHLPSSPADQDSLVIAFKVKDWQALLTQLEKHQALVNDHFNALFGEERKKALNQDDFYHSLAEGHIDLQQLVKKLQSDSDSVSVSGSNTNSGSTEVCESVLADFISQVDTFLAENSVINLSSRGSKRLKTFFPALLAGCLATPTPDITLNRLLKILRSILKRTAYLELLSENPPVLQHLIDLAGQSEWITTRLAEFPVLFDELLYPNSLYAPLQTADLQSELQQTLLRIEQDDEEALLDALRTFKQINELRVAAALLSERVSISQVSRYLTQLAEVILARSAELCWRFLVAKHGSPHALSGLFSDSGFAVIGYGKLGGFELGFGSDLDLVFLYNQPVEASTTGERPVSNSRFYTRLAQKLIHFLSARTNLGLLYEVDMRLRPSGASGLLVSHIDAYRDYQMESAWTWEHQALVRARFIAGDRLLQDQFEDIRLMALQKQRTPQQLKTDVVDMRARMREQLEEKAPGKIDLKQAAGGMVDIEFIAQYLCLAYRGDAYIPNNTAECLNFAQQNRLLDEKDAHSLVKIYRLFRNQLNAMSLREQGRMVPRESSEEDTPEQSPIDEASTHELSVALQKVQGIWDTIFAG